MLLWSWLDFAGLGWSLVVVNSSLGSPIVGVFAPLRHRVESALYADLYLRSHLAPCGTRSNEETEFHFFGFRFMSFILYTEGVASRNTA